MTDTVDTVIVGAGTAGCVLAAGLAERYGDSVLVLEAGPDFGSALPHELHAGAPQPVGGSYDWGLEAAVVGGRTGPVSRGRVVGGSGQINDRGACRPPTDDFDMWAARGAPDWTWDRVIGSFIAIESDQQFGERDYHGDRGPVPITRWQEHELLPAMSALVEAATAVGHPYCPDLNAPSARGIGPYPQNRIDAVRASSNLMCLEPVRRAGKVTVRGDALVSRVVVRDGRAVGVEVGSVVVRAGRVVLAAGAPFSTALLLRSGIGPADDLRALGIEVAADRPGVGRGLRDQPGAVIPIVPTAQAGSPSWPRSQVVARFAQLPGHQADDASYLSMFSGMPIPQVDEMAGRSVPTLVMVGDLAPASVGSVRLASADPAALPEVRLDFYSAAGDLERMIAAYRGGWEIVHTYPFLSTVEQIALVDDRLVGDDEALGRLLQGITASRWNLLGGACMGEPTDAAAVVDNRCAVIGVEGLSVVDLSIVPVALRAPAALTAMMIGEHAVGLLGPAR